MKTIFDGDTIKRNGRTYRVNIEQDCDAGAPWEECDGHGIISDWTRRAKSPGEKILANDRRQYRYYDVAETMKKARAESWGLRDSDKATLARRLGKSPDSLTRGEIIAEAVQKDFEHLRGWCTDQWCYVGVIVTDITDNPDAKPDYLHALWGFESDCNDYIAEVVDEFIGQMEGEREAAKNKARTNYHNINRTALTLVREIKNAGRKFTPAICLALQDCLASMLAERRKLSAIFSE